jgi:Ring finger domain
MSGFGWAPQELEDAIFASSIEYRAAEAASYIDHLELVQQQMRLDMEHIEQLCLEAEALLGSAMIEDDNNEWDLDELRLALEESLKEPPPPVVCAICMDNIDEERETEHSPLIIRLPCFHAFHAGCACDWVTTNHTCPLCRFQVSSLDDCAFQGTGGSTPLLEHRQYTQNDVQGPRGSTNVASGTNPTANNIAAGVTVGAANRFGQQLFHPDAKESMLGRATRRLTLRRRAPKR